MAVGDSVKLSYLMTKEMLSIDNFGSWKLHIEVVLNIKVHWNYVTGKVTESDEEAGDKKECLHADKKISY